jgi:dihydroorotate dehydrogenase (NAD+) catalytic subunit
MKYDLSFDPPFMNAAGSLGFAPDRHGPVDLARLGAFVTNPVSLAPRRPAQGQRFVAYPGGFLLHTGYPNPGLRAVLRRYTAQWERSPLPVIVHLLCERPDQLAHMLEALERQKGVIGVELGLPPGVAVQDALALLRTAAGELPVIARLPLERAAELAEALVGALPDGLAAFSLGPARGALPQPGGGLGYGRLYGPALYPHALAALDAVQRAGKPVIAAGGIYTQEQAQAMLAAGAVAVQLDAVLWRGSW